MDTIIKLIRILATYVNILISCPSVRLPAMIILAPIHEISKIHEYMENCMTGEFSASSFSALTNKLLPLVFRLHFPALLRSIHRIDEKLSLKSGLPSMR